MLVLKSTFLGHYETSIFFMMWSCEVDCSSTIIAPYLIRLWTTIRKVADENIKTLTCVISFLQLWESLARGNVFTTESTNSAHQSDTGLHLRWFSLSDSKGYSQYSSTESLSTLWPWPAGQVGLSRVTQWFFLWRSTGANPRCHKDKAGATKTGTSSFPWIHQRFSDDSLTPC